MRTISGCWRNGPRRPLGKRMTAGRRCRPIAKRSCRCLVRLTISGSTQPCSKKEAARYRAASRNQSSWWISVPLPDAHIGGVADERLELVHVAFREVIRINDLRLEVLDPLSRCIDRHRVGEVHG